MPSIMGVFDALCDSRVSIYETELSKQNLPKKGIHHANNFANLSANVIKILSNVPDEEINKNFASEDSHKKTTRKSPRTSPEKTINRSTENSEIISPNVQKMLSNLPETELVITTHTEEKRLDGSSVNKNESFNGVKVSASENSIGDRKGTCEVYNSKSDSDLKCSAAGFNNNNNSNSEDVECPRLPLGSYLHTTSTGIASRTPVGRKNLGKYLQVMIIFYF